jgi:hypothetical protein
VTKAPPDDHVGGINNTAITLILLFAAGCLWPLLATVGKPTAIPDDPVTRAEERYRHKLGPRKSLDPRLPLIEFNSVEPFNRR